MYITKYHMFRTAQVEWGLKRASRRIISRVQFLVMNFFFSKIFFFEWIKISNKFGLLLCKHTQRLAEKKTIERDIFLAPRHPARR